MFTACGFFNEWAKSHRVTRDLFVFHGDLVIHGLLGKGVVSCKSIGVCVCRTEEMKLRVVCRKLYDYVRYDLKEIAFPSSLPDPPHLKKRRKLTWHERLLVIPFFNALFGST